jgi:hypothetical protein
MIALERRGSGCERVAGGSRSTRPEAFVRRAGTAASLGVLLACLAAPAVRADDDALLDQSQTRAAGGFWFSESVVRTQEFTPLRSPLSRLDLNLMSVGPAGDVTIELRDSASVLLWQGSIKQAQVVDGWNRVVLSQPLAVSPGRVYSVSLYTKLAPDPSGPWYSWRGDEASSYSGGETDVSAEWPSFDYAFRTYADQAAAPPELGLEIDSRSYRRGQVLSVTKCSIEHITRDRTADWRVWLRAPGSDDVELVRLDWLRLQAGRAMDLTAAGAIQLFALPEGLPDGEWELGSRLIDSDTGATLSLRTARFTVGSTDAKR